MSPLPVITGAMNMHNEYITASVSVLFRGQSLSWSSDSDSRLVWIAASSSTHASIS